jgi:hypothetical protein
MAYRLIALLLVLVAAVTAPGQSPTQSAMPAANPETAAAAAGSTEPASHPPCPALSPKVLSETPSSGVRGLIWGGAEYLLWWVEGPHVPPLVTTSPPATPFTQAGIPGLASTTVLFGGRTFHDDGRSGVRLTIGTWLDGCRTCGVGGEFFILGNSGEDFTARSTGTPLLARPIFNTLTQAPEVRFVAAQGFLSGDVSASSESQLLGAAAYFRHVLSSECDCAFEGVWGYRYLNLNERITIDHRANVTNSPPGAPPPILPQTLVHDSFRTQTQFNGGDIGLAGYVTRGRLVFSTLGKLGIGVNSRDLRLEGSTGISALGSPPANFTGGLLTAGRTGETSDRVFALVPEIRVGVGYQITDCVRLTVGYNAFWWTNVARAGEQIDLAVNPNQLPPPLSPVVVQTPAIRDTTLWVQGLSLGLLFNY